LLSFIEWTHIIVVRSNTRLRSHFADSEILWLKLWIIFIFLPSNFLRKLLISFLSWMNQIWYIPRVHAHIEVLIRGILTRANRVIHRLWLMWLKSGNSWREWSLWFIVLQQQEIIWGSALYFLGCERSIIIVLTSCRPMEFDIRFKFWIKWPVCCRCKLAALSLSLYSHALSLNSLFCIFLWEEWLSWVRTRSWNIPFCWDSIVSGGEFSLSCSKSSYVSLPIFSWKSFILLIYCVILRSWVRVAIEKHVFPRSDKTSCVSSSIIFGSSECVCIIIMRSWTKIRIIGLFNEIFVVNFIICCSEEL
jgi:hypothetical protein